MIRAVRCLAVAFVCLVAGCSAIGGNYVQGERQSADVDRGDTNGRRFDFVSNKPDQDDWQIRVTGSSVWVSYARERKADRLGAFNLTERESKKLWRLIDALDIPDRKAGKKDEDEGYVSLQLKEPGEDGGALYHVYISRASNDEDLIRLATYLQDLVEKYKKERPNF